MPDCELDVSLGEDCLRALEGECGGDRVSGSAEWYYCMNNETYTIAP